MLTSREVLRVCTEVSRRSFKKEKRFTVVIGVMI